MIRRFARTVGALGVATTLGLGLLSPVTAAGMPTPPSTLDGGSSPSSTSAGWKPGYAHSG